MKNRIGNGVALAQVVSRIRNGGPWEVQLGANRNQEAFDVGWRAATTADLTKALNEEGTKSGSRNDCKLIKSMIFISPKRHSLVPWV